MTDTACNCGGRGRPCYHCANTGGTNEHPNTGDTLTETTWGE